MLGRYIKREHRGLFICQPGEETRSRTSDYWRKGGDFEDQSVQKRAQKRVSKEPIVIVDGEGLDEVVTEPNECKKKRKT